MSTDAPALTEEVSTTVSKEERRARRWQETKTDLKWATALLFVLILGLSGALWTSWRQPAAGEEDLSQVTQLIFAQDGLVAPFEILSVLLLAALIAGVVISLRDPPEPGPVPPVNQQPAAPAAEAAPPEAPQTPGGEA